MFRVFILSIIALFSVSLASSQEALNSNRKRIKTSRITKAPKIDGVLNDHAWKDVEVAKDFVELRPSNGKAAEDSHKTEVKITYDNDAIYISANMFDPNPSKIPMEFTNRDNFGQTDFS